MLEGRRSETLELATSVEMAESATWAGCELVRAASVVTELSLACAGWEEGRQLSDANAVSAVPLGNRALAVASSVVNAESAPG